MDRRISSAGIESRVDPKVTDALLSMPPDEPDDPSERVKLGLMSMGEVDEYESGEDELFEGDDMSSIAHGELQQHRELREYARIAAWEMPLLSSMSPIFSSATDPLAALWPNTSHSISLPLVHPSPFLNSN